MKAKIKYYLQVKKNSNGEHEALFVLEYKKVIFEILNSNYKDMILEILVSNKKPELIKDIKKFYVDYCLVEDFELEKISNLKNNQGLVALTKKRKLIYEKANPYRKINLVLDNIQDPGNLGTIIRTANWFGIKNIFCSKDCVDVFNTKSIQASMGSFLNVDIYYLDLLHFLKKYENLPIVSACLQGEDINNMKTIKEGFIILGNEGVGISKELLSISSFKTYIPCIGEKINSLNVSVACGIILNKIVAT